MTDFDLDRLGDVWRQRPTPEELESLRRTADQVSRKARWAQLLDVGAAVLIAAGILVMVIAHPAVETTIFGAAAILILLVGQIRQRRFRSIELRALTGGTEEMIDQSIERVEASLKRARFSLIVLGPGLAVGWLLARAVYGRAGRPLTETLSGEGRLGLLLIGVVMLVVLGFHIARVIVLGRKEREELIKLREAYRKERESTV